MNRFIIQCSSHRQQIFNRQWCYIDRHIKNSENVAICYSSSEETWQCNLTSLCNRYPLDHMNLFRFWSIVQMIIIIVLFSQACWYQSGANSRSYPYPTVTSSPSSMSAIVETQGIRPNYNCFGMSRAWAMMDSVLTHLWMVKHDKLCVGIEAVVTLVCQTATVALEEVFW